MTTPTLREFCITAAYSLGQAGVDAPSLSARLLLGHVLGLSPTGLTLHAQSPLSPEALRTAQELVNRRALGEPVALIVGHKEFYGREFCVSPATLVPRPETEDLVDYALQHAAAAGTADQALFFCDVGTGSGCIALTLGCEKAPWRGIMLDNSGPALALACRNARALGMEEKILAVQGDLAHLCFKAEVFDLIISNPPYVSGAEYAAISPEVRNFEPRSALQPAVNGVKMLFEPTGLGHIRALARQAHSFLKAGGLFLMEHGSTQGSAVEHIFTNSPHWEQVEIHQDLAGLERFCSARKALK